MSGILENEIWLVVPHINYLEASNLGRVRIAATGRICSTTKHEQGYLLANIPRPGGGHYMMSTVHSLVAACFIGPRPAGQIIRHLDDNPGNNHVSNLRYGTKRENAEDARRNGRRMGRRLNGALAADLRLRHAAGENPAALAQSAGVSLPAMRRVLRNISYPAGE